MPSSLPDPPRSASSRVSDGGDLAPAEVPVAHVALVALGLVMATSAVAGRSVPGPLLAAAALGAWTVYAALRLLDANDGGTDTQVASVADSGARWTWIALAVLATVAAVGRLPRPAWAVAALVALTAGADAWRRSQGPRRRDAWAKPGLVALGWTGGAVALPLASMPEPGPWGGALVWHAAAVALAVGANVLGSDAADRASDARAGRVTVATRHGSGAARGLGAVLAAGGAMCALAAATAAGLSSGATSALVAAPVCVGLLGTLVPPVTPARRVAVDLAVGLGGLATLMG